MSHRILIALVVLSFGAGPVFAQNTKPSSPPAQGKRDPKLLTVTGCLVLFLCQSVRWTRAR